MYQDAYRPPTQFSVFPPVVKNLLILNGLLFLAQMVAANPQAIFLREFLNLLALYPPGAPDVGYTIFGQVDEIPGFWPWQLVTYAFLHGSFMHILFNLFILWMFGFQLENVWGSKRFGTFYFVCVIGAALVHLPVMWGSPIPTLGASGGVFGVLLAFGMMFPNQPIYLYFLVPIKAKYLVAALAAFELYAAITGTQAGVANFAHLGGMLFGLIMILYWRGKFPIKPDRVMRY